MDMSTPEPLPAKLAIVAALEREVWPLVKDWQVARREHEGRKFKFFENENTVLVCGGIGAPAARRATEAAIALHHPTLVLSAGFAGALEAGLQVGTLFVPDIVINAQDGSRLAIGAGRRVLVSVAAIASVEQKRKLAKAYGAQAVDMEAAAVFQGAQARGVRFSACKVISDELEFELPSMAQFVGIDGQFRTGSFVGFVMLRPWLWPRVARLRKNSAVAAEKLGFWLGALARALRSSKDTEKLENFEAAAHPISGAGV
jgi:adenosylhomocysteine nucleosidase